MITVSRRRVGPAAAQVLEQVRARGTAYRDELATDTGFSLATIGRAVGQLTAAGVLRECSTRSRPRGIGRPGTPVEVDDAGYTTLGIHVGRTVVTVALGDLLGRVLVSDVVRREAGTPPDLEDASRRAARLLAQQPGRRPLTVGAAGAWRDLGLEAAEVAHQLGELTGLRVFVGDHVAAVAAAEFFHRRTGTTGVTLYVYARDTLGFAVATDKGQQTEVSRVGSLAHFPTGSGVACPCGRTGCLEVTASDHAVLERARAAGVDATAVDELYADAARPEVRHLLAERAHLLGTVAASVRDIVAPDRVVLVGQAFTGCPPVLEDVVAGYSAAPGAVEAPVSFTRFGSGIQATAACTIALGPVYDDPLAVLAVDGGRAGQAPGERREERVLVD
jgi:predicted NBD/HSP70 family sugar kinase